MTIIVHCSCGTKVQAADSQAGRKARCPSCQGIVDLPGEPEEPGGYGVEQVRKCPGCKREWPLDTAVCVDCGYNFTTGRKMRTAYNIADRVIVVGVVWLGSFTRYRVYRSKRGRPCLDVSGSFLFIPLGSKTYDLSEYSAILTDHRASGDEYETDYFYLYLEGDRKKTVNIFSASDEIRFKELIDAVAQAGRLEIKRK
jgi:hypothetical protein